MIHKRVHDTKAYRTKRAFIIVFTIILLLFIYLFENASFLLRAVSTIEFLIVFYLIDHFFEIKFKARHYIYILVIAITGFLLSPLYFVLPNYDKVQHFVCPMLLAAILYFMLSKLNLERKWRFAFAFFITIAILGIFEIGEFGLDHLFNMKLQGVYLRDTGGLEKFNLLMDPLDDTMIDLILGTLGSGLYALFGYFLTKDSLEKKKN